MADEGQGNGEAAAPVPGAGDGAQAAAPASLAGGAAPANSDGRSGDIQSADAGGAKPGDAKPEIVPFDSAKLTLPEGVAKGEGLDKFSSFAKEQGLTQAQAQGVLDLYGTEMKAVLAAQEKTYSDWAAKQSAWQNEIKSEYAGPKLVEAQTRISRMIDNFGGADVREVLNTTGAGNSPALFRLLDKAATALSEGSHVSGRPAGASRDLAEKMYPSMTRSN